MGEESILAFFTAAALSASVVVLFVTQALKYIPVAWTSKYSVYVNIVLSFIGAIVVKGLPVFGVDLWQFILQWIIIAVVAAIAYLSLLKPALKDSEPISR